MDLYSSDVLWVVILGFFVSFFLAFGVGANDVSNAFGTSVGSGVLTFRQACILATIFETSGAVLLGYKVSDTIRKGIIDVKDYEGSERELALGMLSALIGSAVWIMLATYFKLPVSTTHSIVGSTVGFSLAARGTIGLNYKVLGTIVASWFISPLMSGISCVLILAAIRFLIMDAKKPLQAGLIALPIIYALTIFVNVLTVTLNGSKLLGMENLALWHVFAISVSAMLLVGILSQLFVVPWQRKKILSSEQATWSRNSVGQSFDSIATVAASTVSIDAAALKNQKIESDATVNRLFHFLQTLSAVFTSFAHGGSDVSNAIGPLIAIWMIYTEGSVLQKAESPILLLLYGGIGMCIGLWVLGKRVNDTVGHKLTKIHPTTGFSVEVSAAMTVLLASKLGIPISSTHCIVGGIVSAGWIYGQIEGNQTKKVDWSLFRSIIYAWIITLPAAGACSALLMLIFKYSLTD
ncbi:Sodium-dependent phosphate transporter 2 [Pseudolycoriella hygida]|uniref:Phosphate transporter n=1 Tax=Pseudolycoriella hygida TaxID=35572 RepID=A0A9Q0RY81_9DIPT|nr:Sodium-dependent phosphate transporter 2 [Pseudolycoriella hygida]